jgi:hypothetical protein
LEEEVGRRAAAIAAALALLAGCSSPRSGAGEAPPRPRAEPQVTIIRPLVGENAARPDWCHAKDLIAFDRGGRTGVSEVWTVAPDGKGQRCLTCDARGLAKGLRGHPSWHPSCAWLAVQVSNRHARNGRYEQLAWGIHHDLWAVAADGSWAVPLVQTGRLGGARGPKISRDGTRLLFAARRSTGRRIPQVAGQRTPGAEDPWAGWRLEIASFEPGPDGRPHLAGRPRPVRGAPAGGFVQADALVGDTVWFSYTRAGFPYVDDVYQLREGGDLVNLTRSPGVWDQHAVPSPSGRFVAFVSSAPFGWRHPPDSAARVRLELFALGPGGRRIQLSHLNEHLVEEIGDSAVAGEHAWGPGARAIALAYALVAADGSPSRRIDLIELSGFR